MPSHAITSNTLFYGDNLQILREYVADESIDLVYLDPPFNSNRNYNVLFRNEAGQDSEAQITAFEDTWHWGPDAEHTYHGLVTAAPEHVGQMIGAMRQFVGANQMMAYLVMMAARLVELQRVLKPTGSLYLHCDPTANHYLKVILDTIFGPLNFRNEIIWRRSHPKGQASTRFARNHDVILAFAKNAEQLTWNPAYAEYDPDRAAAQYSLRDETGRPYQLTSLLNPNPDRPNLTYEFKGVTKVWRWTKERMLEADAKGHIVVPRGGQGIPRYKRYLDEQEGVPIDDVWGDVEFAGGTERLGYPTQKPLALLERIIATSSNPGDVVLDPFCGCGTAVAAAQKLGRRWIGIDITHLSIALQKYRLEQMYPGIVFKVIGEPEDIGAAAQLAKDDPYQFQWWALSLIRARPLGGQAGSKVGKKGADKGIDGVITFIDDATQKPKRLLVQVKGGHVQRGDIGQLRGVIEREQAAIGVFITLDPATQPMKVEAASAGYYHSPGWGKDYPRLQILSIAELFAGKEIQMPPTEHGTFKQAARIIQTDGEQQGFNL